MNAPSMKLTDSGNVAPLRSVATMNSANEPGMPTPYTFFFPTHATYSPAAQSGHTPQP